MPAANGSTSPASDPLDAGKTPAPRRAIRSAPAVIAFLLIASGGLALDLWSKQHVFDAILSKPELVEFCKERAPGAPSPDSLLREAAHVAEPGKPALAEEQVFWKVKYTLSTNPGVVFGIIMPRMLVAVVSVITILLVFFFFASGPERAWTMHVALACILAGALGNLYDRLFSQVWIPGMDQPITRQVRDFINLGDIHVGSFNYPYIFNVADVLLVVGVALMIVNWFLHRKDDQPAGRATPSK